ncbi:capsular biosynthesis protein [Vibrio sp. IRLE0018]|uniref:capsular biosynthesis protein n=1 Tax=Vibrio floridensis TaxID=2908007 RepID=UPI001F269972|nr:capsular biosynthesis protein [Vibrio floridensis]
MMVNNGLYLQAFTWITLVACGLIQYFTGVGAVLWLPFLFACCMVLLLLLQTRFSHFALDAKEQCIVLMLLALFIVSLLSTFLQNGLTVTIVGFKNELAMALVTFCLALGFCRESQIYRVTQSLYWIFYLQFPVILYQVMIVLPKRVASLGEYEKWDSVVGTFGGDPMGGGNTAALGLFCLLIMLLKLSEYKHGVASKLSTAAHIIAAFTLCILGEIKFVILISPLLLAFVWFAPSYVKGMRRYGFKMVLIILFGMLVLITAAILILAASYASAFGGDPSKGALTIFLDSLSYVFDPHYILPSGELGRMTTLFFWLENSGLYGVPSQLFGYGLNATNHGSSVAPGFLNQVFNVLLDSTSLSMMLWEFGIVGVLLFMLPVGTILWIALPKASLEQAQLEIEDRRMVASQPAFIAFVLAGLMSIPYSQILMLVPMLQFLFYFSLGALLVNRKSVLEYYALNNHSIVTSHHPQREQNNE